VAVLAYTVNVVDYDQVARAVLATGIGWVLVDSPIPLGPLRADFPDLLVCSVTADSEAVGRLSADLARSLLPGGGKALVIEGPSGTAVAIHRLNGLMEGLRGSNLQILETLVGDWKTSAAEKQAEAWLDRAGDAAARPDIVISQNDEMAEGVLRAFRARRPAWGKVAAIGIDGLPDYGQRLVQEGVLAATILNPSPTGPGVDVVARWLRGERVDFVAIPVRPYPSIEELSPISGAG
jgi:simple sugar transport system substrate-binding protein